MGNATHMFIVTHGRFHYHRVDREEDECAHPEVVDKNEDWIAEPVLWTKNWVHRGVLIAVNEADLMMIVPKTFEEVIHLNPKALELACVYARNYMTWVNENAAMLSDISQGEDVEELCRGFMELEEDDEVATPPTKRSLWDIVRRPSIASTRGPSVASTRGSKKS